MVLVCVGNRPINAKAFSGKQLNLVANKNLNPSKSPFDKGDFED